MGEGGFTLAEFLIASALFLMLAVGLVSSNLFGVQLTQIMTPRQDADAQAREFIGRLSAEIQSATNIVVGTGDWSGVTKPTNSAYVGNALRLVTTEMGTTVPATIIYYLNGENLMRYRGTYPGTVEIESVTNTTPFMAVRLDSLTNSLSAAQAVMPTNDVSRYLIRVHLQLSTVGRDKYPVGGVGEFSGNQIRFAAAQRAEGD